MLQIILEPIIALLFIGIGYLFGFFPVMLFSVGAIEPGPIGRIQDYSFYSSQGMRWWHLTYSKDGRRYMPAEGVAVVGWLVFGSAVGISFLLVKFVCIAMR